MNVLEAARKRVDLAFRDFEKVYLAFSGGKDSTVLFHLAIEAARKHGKKLAVQIIDLEAQYSDTIRHMQELCDKYADLIDLHWICVPLSLRNATSVIEPKWICWEPDKEWVRKKPKFAKTDYPFFRYGMEFEEFTPKFARWYSDGKTTAALIGIRTEESYNRFRAINRDNKDLYYGEKCTTIVSDKIVNFYPIYDWAFSDIWGYTAKEGLEFNPIYEKMFKAQVPFSQMRLCQPYGDDQRRGLWLYHLLEPDTWTRVVKRVSGANSGALYSNETGNISGYKRIAKPQNASWQQFFEVLLATTPEPSKSQYESVKARFLDKWSKRGYPDGIPDEAHPNMEMNDRAPSWRRICWMLLRNDFYGKGLGFNAIERKDYEYTL